MPTWRHWLLRCKSSETTGRHWGVHHAVLLVCGDKSTDWKGWYVVNIPIADDRFSQHQDQLSEQLTSGKKGRKR
ncbi:MAG: hypothetical protein M3O32_03475 [Actinomycetota bacterium]|nr:hypothetical protein [Actinomycetota bacterium]